MPSALGKHDGADPLKRFTSADPLKHCTSVSLTGRLPKRQPDGKSPQAPATPLHDGRSAVGPLLTPMSDNKKQLLRRIGNLIITILTALLTALTTQSCIGQ